MRVFVAGATGVIGQRLVPRLVAAGHQVVATTRSPAKTDMLRALGAEPVIVDGLDAMAVGEAVGHAEPEVVIHQMTQLAGIKNLRRFDREFEVTNRLRTQGTDHLLAAATAAGARRFIAQSYTGWNNSLAAGGLATEEEPLNPDPPAAQRQSAAAIMYLEKVVTGASAVQGVVLRYGSFYGPGASDEFFRLVRKRKLPVAGDGGGVWSFIHIDDAAAATVAALDHGSRGIYNIVDDEPAKVADWLPYLADVLGAKPPMHVPAWLARLAAGEVGVSALTRIRGSSNAKAKAELGWAPAWASWRDGFRQAAAALAEADRAGRGSVRSAR
jgi:nucleoside-diphosphate-sugar epimerase